MSGIRLRLKGLGRVWITKDGGGIANVTTGYYLALLVDPPRSLFPLNYHY